VSELGATEVIDPETVGDHGPYDVVLELVGAAGLPSALSALALEARVVVIGVGSGSRIELDLSTLMGRRARIGGATLRVRNRTEKAEVMAALETQVLPLLASGRLQVPVCATYPLTEAAAAYERFAAGAKCGKIVLVA
jgi:NADPH:quinone reductase-like Zn-dependent oxidoreductase